MHSYTLPSTSALDGVGGQGHTPAALPPGKTRYPLYRRLGAKGVYCISIILVINRLLNYFSTFYCKETQDDKREYTFIKYKHCSFRP